MLFRGNVYVGSSTGVLDAISARTGAIVWSVNAGSAISVQPIVSNGTDVAVGTADQILTFYDSASGSFVGNQVTAAINGLTSTGQIVLIASPSGIRLVNGPVNGSTNWSFTGTGVPVFAAPGVLLNGDMFAAGTDGVLRAFSVPGRGIA